MNEGSSFEIRKVLTFSEEVRTVMGAQDDGGPLRKVAVAAVVKNPLAGQGMVPDLSPLIERSRALGTLLGERALAALGEAPQSYGKAGVAGSAGEQEHVNASLTSAFGDAARDAIGGGAAWISSTEKVGGPGITIDVPLANKDEVWVRSHYDTFSLCFADAPLPDELVVIFALANRGRINARVGGLSHQEAMARRNES